MTPCEPSSTDIQSDCAEAGAVGSSPAWQRVVTAAMRVAATEATVLLQGESGTGKEVIARLIHRASPRRHGPFVAINCAALPEQLLESELFGYERGAFTGAQQPKAGQIEMAARGVLFLDEVSEMSLTAQAKLLRFLQEREYQRLGGTRLHKADVRIIAASNRSTRPQRNRLEQVESGASSRIDTDAAVRTAAALARRPVPSEERNDHPVAGSGQQRRDIDIAVNVVGPPVE